MLLQKWSDEGRWSPGSWASVPAVYRRGRWTKWETHSHPAAQQRETSSHKETRTGQNKTTGIKKPKREISRGFGKTKGLWHLNFIGYSWKYCRTWTPWREIIGSIMYLFILGKTQMFYFKNAYKKFINK